MSMTEQGMSLTEQLEEASLSLAARQSLERIRELARQNRRQYAIEKSGKPKLTKIPKRNAKKSNKPVFYNPATRD